MVNRVVSQCREFNLREDMTPELHCLPPRFHKEALPESSKMITEEELNNLINNYYRWTNW